MQHPLAEGLAAAALAGEIDMQRCESFAVDLAEMPTLTGPSSRETSASRQRILGGDRVTSAKSGYGRRVMDRRGRCRDAPGGHVDVVIAPGVTENGGRACPS
jgi:hypothetical protein